MSRAVPARADTTVGDARAVDVPAAPAIVATFAFVLAVACTPREQFWAFGCHAVLLALGAVALRVALRVPIRRLRSRLMLEVPFVVFALALPLVGRGPRIDVLGWSLSEPGLWAAWSILAKATLGVIAAALLVTAVPPVAIVTGLEQLRLPRVVTATMAFMLRYADVIAEEQRRMRIARVSRGDDARWLWQATSTARSLGALFVRSYERGERVQTAMIARGLDGPMPAGLFRLGSVSPAGSRRSSPAVVALIVGPALAVAVAGLAWLTTASPSGARPVDRVHPAVSPVLATAAVHDGDRTAVEIGPLR